MARCMVRSMVAALAATLIGQSARAGDAQAEARLVQIEREWNAALKAGDTSWFQQNLASDFTAVSSGDGSLQTKAQSIAAQKEDKTVYESLELSEIKVRVEGNAGVVTGVNQIKGHDEHGQTFEVKLAFTDTYIKRDGRWQAWASQHTRVKA